MISNNKSKEELYLELQELQSKHEKLTELFDETIIDREKEEENIRRSEARYYKLAEIIDAIVWRFDLKNDKWIYVSPQTERILGYSPDEWLNFQWWVDIMHPEDRAWAPSFCLNQTKKGSWHEFEYRLRHKNGDDVWIYDKVSVETVNGEPAFLYGVMFDITRRKMDEKSHQDFALRKLKTAIENTEASIVITDSEGRIEYVNPFFSKLTGYTPDECLGETPRILKSDIHETEYYEELWQTIKNGKTWTGELCNRKKNGELYWEFATISPVKNEDNEITHFVGVKTDISPLKKLNGQLLKAKEEAEESEMRFKALHNASFGGIAVHDQGIILDCNKGLSEMTGYTENQLIGMNGLLLIAEESKETVLRNVRIGRDRPYEVIGLRRSGEEYPLRLEGRNIPYKGKMVRVVEFRDITLRKRSEQIIQSQNKELQTLNAEKDRFITILAHDLRSPFNGLLGLTRLLVQNGAEYDISKVVTFSEHINKTAQGIFNLLEDLLGWMRAKTGKVPFAPTYIELKELCDEVMDMQSSTAQSKLLSVHCFVDVDVTVFADKYMLSAILRNLITNAIKFTRSDGRVHIHGVQKTEGVEVKISDTGTGIDDEKKEQLFSNLQIQSEPGTNEETGTGLGLLLCKEFVEKHGGKIWVESQVGVGSDFFFTLPNPQK